MNIPTLFDAMILIRKLYEKYNIELHPCKETLCYLNNNNIRTIIKHIKEEIKIEKKNIDIYVKKFMSDKNNTKYFCKPIS